MAQHHSLPLALPQALRRWLAALYLCRLLLCALSLSALPVSAHAQTFPPLSGRVVDAAHILPTDVTARLEQKLAQLDSQSQRQLVVATVPDLEGYDIADYANRLFRTWKLGDKARNDGVLLLIAPKERKLRIEVGYGMEGVVTDGLSFLIIRDQITPKFKAGDLPGGIEAGTDALIHHLQLPEAEARQIAAKATLDAKPQDHGNDLLPALIWIGIFVAVLILPALRRSIILWSMLGGMAGGGRRGDGLGGGDWGGGGGFFGGGGSSGGGGASGGW